MMPRFLTANDIPMSLRKPHLDRYKRQLRDALMNPGLSEVQRNTLKTRLSGLGATKDYAGLKAASSAPSSPPPAPEVAEPQDLVARTKDELLTIAADEGVQVIKSWNKTEIAQAILDHRAAEG
jgi:hypothetical protein